jgi:ArsR family metal-binding transcriptional regulator
MGCSTFYFGSSEDLEGARKIFELEGIGHQLLLPSPVDPSIRIWGISVNSHDSSRTREIIVTRDLPAIGYYDLPNPERPLPDPTATDSPFNEGRQFIKKMWLAFVAQCFADPTKIRLIAHFNEDIGPLLPYINSTVKAARYNPGGPTLGIKKGVRVISLYSSKIAIAKPDDMLDGWQCLKEVKDLIDDVYERRDEITPDHMKSNPPSPVEIYQCLPQTNCGLCGKPSCMAFAAVLFNGEIGYEDCPALLQDQFAENRFQLLELMGETA